MPTAPKQLDVSKLFEEGGFTVELQVKTAEDDREKTLRLRKDFLGFLVKELAPYLLAMGLVVAISFYCFAVLNRSGSTPDEKQRAWTGLTTILGLVVGIITGKAFK